MWLDRNPDLVFALGLLLAMAYTHGPRLLRRTRYALRARRWACSQRRQ
jgi:hypothetical protein